MAVVLVLAFTLGLTGVNYGRHSTVLDQIEDDREEEQMQKITTRWTDTAGAEQEIITPRLEGEEVAAYVARHKEIVDAMQAAFPPKPVVE